MIVGEDADHDTIPRTNRNVNRILRTVADQLIARGFHVYDETAITMDRLPLGGVRRQLPELLETAKLAAAPIDVIVVFSIYGSARQVPFVRDTYKPFIRVEGRMIRVRSGQDLGGYEAGSDIEFPPIPGSCVNGDPPRECLLETFGHEARLIGDGVGGALATKLAGYLRADSDVGPVGPGGVVTAPGPGGDGRPGCDGMDTTPFTIRFRDFDGPELNRVEEYLTAFACYQGHRVVRSQPGLTEYWYESRTDESRLTRNLRFTLEAMNLPGTVTTTGNGGTIIVEKHLVVPPHGVITVPPGTH
jgi:hypothetical protein